MAPKRVNKTKDEIAKEMAHKAKVEKQKALARRMFPLLEVETIYDGQTALNALSGYIKFEMAVRESKLKINDLLLDLKKEPDTQITKVMEALKAEFQDEPAKELSELMERMANTLQSFIARKYVNNPMSEIKMEDIVA